MFFLLLGGAPGSGKSYVAKLLKDKWGGYIIDDPSAPSKCTNIDKELDKIPDGIDLVFITDPFFCLQKVQKLAEEKLWGRFPGCKIAWVILDNNPTQCKINVERRDDGRKVDGSIRRFSREYHVPPGAYILPCYVSEGQFLKEVEKIVL